MNLKIARIGMVAQLAAVVTAGMISGDVVAARESHRIHVGSRHHHHHEVQPVSNLASPGPVHMRYYGGPKSPMWPEAK